MSEKVQVEVGNCFDKLFNPLQLRIVLYILCFIYCIGNRTGTENIMQSHGKQRIREVLQTEAWRIMTISPPPLVFSELIISRTTLILQYIFGLVFWGSANDNNNTHIYILYILFRYTTFDVFLYWFMHSSALWHLKIEIHMGKIL